MAISHLLVRVHPRQHQPARPPPPEQDRTRRLKRTSSRGPSPPRSCVVQPPFLSVPSAPLCSLCLARRPATGRPPEASLSKFKPKNQFIQIPKTASQAFQHQKPGPVQPRRGLEPWCSKGKESPGTFGSFSAPPPPSRGDLGGGQPCFSSGRGCLATPAAQACASSAIAGAPGSCQRLPARSGLQNQGRARFSRTRP